LLDVEPIEKITEDVQAMNWAQLAATVVVLRKLLASQAQALEEIIDERNAARLLNELCHY
jgi:hypothetical protein